MKIFFKTIHAVQRFADIQVSRVVTSTIVVPDVITLGKDEYKDCTPKNANKSL